MSGDVNEAIALQGGSDTNLKLDNTTIEISCGTCQQVYGIQMQGGGSTAEVVNSSAINFLSYPASAAYGVDVSDSILNFSDSSVSLNGLTRSRAIYAGVSGAFPGGDLRVSRSDIINRDTFVSSVPSPSTAIEVEVFSDDSSPGFGPTYINITQSSIQGEIKKTGIDNDDYVLRCNLSDDYFGNDLGNDCQAISR